MLIIAADEPFPRSILASTAYHRARKVVADGRALSILPASALGLQEKI